MWTLIGIALLVIGVVWLLKPDKAKQAKDAQLLQNLDARKGKQPEIFRDLMQEEYPQFREQITFSRVSQMLTAHSEFWDSEEGQSHITKKNGLIVKPSEFKSDANQETYLRQLTEKSAAAISEEFKQHALSNPAAFYKTLDNLYVASNRIMDTHPDTRLS